MTDIPGLVSAVTNTAITVKALDVVGKTTQSAFKSKNFKAKSKKKAASFW